MGMVKISIVIVTYNSRDLIGDCLSSIYKFNDLSKDEAEIIIVDNSNAEEHAELKQMVKSLFGNGPVLLHNPKNGGYGQGNNVGIKAASGEIICIMNPDVRLLQPVFKSTLEHFNNPKTGAVGYKQITGDLDFSFFQRPELFTPFLSSYQIRKQNEKNAFDDSKHYLSGALVFFRKKDLEAIGMYDERMFLYYEEPDIARRINEIGKVSVFDPNKKYHHMMEQKEYFNEKLLKIAADSLKIYYSKFNLNLKSHLRLLYLENRIYIMAFSVIGNKDRVGRARATIKSFKFIE